MQTEMAAAIKHRSTSITYTFCVESETLTRTAAGSWGRYAVTWYGLPAVTRPVWQPVSSESAPTTPGKMNKETYRIRSILEKVVRTLSTIMQSRCFPLCSLEHLVEWPQKIRIKWIRPVGFCRKVAPVFVHPEPGRWILSHIGFEGIPTSLRDLLMVEPGGVADFRMKNESITPVRQRLAVRGNY